MLGIIFLGVILWGSLIYNIRTSARVLENDIKMIEETNDGVTYRDSNGLHWTKTGERCIKLKREEGVYDIYLDSQTDRSKPYYTQYIDSEYKRYLEMKILDTLSKWRDYEKYKYEGEYAEKSRELIIQFEDKYGSYLDDEYRKHLALSRELNKKAHPYNRRKDEDLIKYSLSYIKSKKERLDILFRGQYNTESEELNK